MSTELTEEEMRRALFGSAAPGPVEPETPKAVAVPPTSLVKKKKPGALTSKLTVSLRVGNEFEGKTEIFVYEANTLSTLQAELDAKKEARKKFKYVELVSIKPTR
jgi:hypothetical protein